MKELICITCPRGCHLTVDEEHDFTVTGNACPRGAEYGRNELLHPVRTVTSTVRTEGSPIPRLPVKTDRPIPKEKVFDCMAHCLENQFFSHTSGSFQSRVCVRVMYTPTQTFSVVRSVSLFCS